MASPSFAVPTSRRPALFVPVRKRKRCPLSHGRRIGSEFLGSAFLLATVIGSGIMGAKPSGRNEGLALLGNTLPTGAMLVVLITMLSPISGAHLNPAVTGVFWLKGEIKSGLALGYIFAQLAGGIAGVLAAHLMFDLPLLQLSTKIRSGPAQWFAEYVATFWTRLDDPRDPQSQARCRTYVGWALHHRCALVYSFDILLPIPQSRWQGRSPIRLRVYVLQTLLHSLSRNLTARFAHRHYAGGCCFIRRPWKAPWLQ